MKKIGTDPNILDARIGRVSAFKLPRGDETRVRYQYLGVGDLVGTAYQHTTPVSVYRRHDGATNASYDALDRFNRVKTDRWGNESNKNAFEHKLSYDANSNITQIEDTRLINGRHTYTGQSVAEPARAYSTQYTMDGLDRVTAANRGILDNGSIVGDIRLNDAWTLTRTGNWANIDRKLNNDSDTNESSVAGMLGWSEFTDARTHNNVNAILSRCSSGGVSGTWNATHDKAGQTTDDGRRYTYKYDAFGRLVEIKDRATTPNTIAQYKYNGLGHRVAAQRDVDGTAGLQLTDWEYYVYDWSWRLVTVLHETASSSPSSSTAKVAEITIPHVAGVDGEGGSSYIDSYAIRERDADLSGVFETRDYYAQNWRADTVMMIAADGQFGGQIRYSAYGEHEALTLGDTDDGNGNGVRDGGVGIEDLLYFLALFEDGDMGADVDDASGTGARDDGVGIEDLLYGLALNEAGGLVPDSRYLYAGYVHDPIKGPRHGGGGVLSPEGNGVYHVRHRVYSPETGRWVTRDPLGYVDEMSLLEYAGCNPSVWIDYLGLQRKLISDGDSIRPWRPSVKSPIQPASAPPRIYELDPDDPHSPGIAKKSIIEISNDLTIYCDQNGCRTCQRTTISTHGIPGSIEIGPGQFLTPGKLDDIEKHRKGIYKGPNPKELEDTDKALKNIFDRSDLVDFFCCEAGAGNSGKALADKLHEMYRKPVTIPKRTVRWLPGGIRWFDPGLWPWQKPKQKPKQKRGY